MYRPLVRRRVFHFFSYHTLFPYLLTILLPSLHHPSVISPSPPHTLSHIHIHTHHPRPSLTLFQHWPPSFGIALFLWTAILNTQARQPTHSSRPHFQDFHCTCCSAPFTLWEYRVQFGRVRNNSGCTATNEVLSSIFCRSR